MTKTRLLIADDNPLVLEQITTVLNGRFDVVARAVNGEEAVSLTIRHSPDLVVLDISMPVMTGLRAAEQLRERGCRAPIVFLTVHDDEEFLRAAMAAGGLGYVLKSRMTSDLATAIDAVLLGRPFVSEPLRH